MPTSPQLPLATDELPEHVRLNRAVWDQWAAEYATYGERAWAAAEPSWGIWDAPESELHMLPDDMRGMDARDAIASAPNDGKDVARHSPVATTIFAKRKRELNIFGLLS